MIRRIGGAMTACAALVAAAGASAQVSSWQTFHAASDPAISLQAPANATQETHLDPAKGQVMAFFATVGEEDLSCFVSRAAYAPGADRALWAKGLASDKATLLCADEDPAISGFAAMGAQPVKSNGSPASVCQAHYLRKDVRKPGVVVSSLTVAAPGAVYKLVCKLNAVDELSAEAAWESDQDDISRIQASLRLGKQ